MLAASDARRAVLDAVEFDGASLRVGGATFDFARVRGGRLLRRAGQGRGVDGLGARRASRRARSRAACSRAAASRLVLSDRWRVYEGGHPLPNAESFEAARAAFEMLRRADDAAAARHLPRLGRRLRDARTARATRALTLEDLREANRALVSCGASIAEVNAVRRALSAVKGGGLAACAPRAAQVTLVVSDVADGPRLRCRLRPDARAPTTTRLTSKRSSSVTDSLRVSRPRSCALSKSQLAASLRVGSPPRRAAGLSKSCSTTRARARRPSAPRAARGFVVEFARDLVEQHVERGRGGARLAARASFAREGGADGRGCLSRLRRRVLVPRARRRRWAGATRRRRCASRSSSRRSSSKRDATARVPTARGRALRRDGRHRRQQPGRGRARATRRPSRAHVRSDSTPEVSRRERRLHLLRAPRRRGRHRPDRHERARRAHPPRRLSPSIQWSRLHERFNLQVFAVGADGNHAALGRWLRPVCPRCASARGLPRAGGRRASRDRRR